MYEVGIADRNSFEKKSEIFSKKNPQFASEEYKLSAENIDYNLIFNEQESLFSKIEILESDFSTQPNLVNILLTNSQVYSNGNIVLGKPKIKALNGFLIPQSQIKWNLLKETKKIMGYDCIKAEGVFEMTSSKGCQTIEVIAWYTPEIPLFWGPDFYNGLPGVILQVETSQNLKYLATNISLNKKIKLTKPKGKIITKDDMEKKIIKLKSKFGMN